ncbi:MAG: hypothetical protein LIO65_08215 [Odoribacter sp.]|nr:hypothetical protein [Odoribacter sp.]
MIIIYIYRAAEAWLMVAEALSNLGSQQAVDSIINNGLRNSYNGSSFNPPFDFPIYNINMRENRGLRGRVGADLIHVSDIVIDS